ncbi:MAG: hypothetical protein HYY87_03360 [Candidatus Levybacteria bacterium]|nr:hypothetical protein [Candidatus Levybacteria bacterium]MBI2622494.1 hypothetical protein [Candidatus Levybacteria bacterium]MBI3070314.1 hypothetical protein [Candidatus Levybacteria bacterium]MBI3092733.1 hypothetical protein [Candidatus Levybacteria bacterium]
MTSAQERRDPGSSNGINGEGGIQTPPDAEHKRLLEKWEKAPIRILRYPSGMHPNPPKDPYRYKKGVRLFVNGLQVMDTCETPWCEATVSEAFKAIREQKREGPYIVFERGFGLGITARQIVKHLDLLGGRYDVVELNASIAKRARVFADTQTQAWRAIKGDLPAESHSASIKVYEGDAILATRKRAQKISEGREEPADIIISDTYPLSTDEQGINDLLDLGTLKHCLSPHGIFTFYPYFPGSTGGIIKAQRDLIAKHFRDYRYLEVQVNPSPQYRYLHTGDVPVRTLPVVICRYPKI